MKSHSVLTCQPDTIYAFTSMVGTVTLIIVGFKLIGFLRKFFIRESFDLSLRYGNGTWVLITAPTSTTGCGFALQLAKRGFNIVLAGRDIKKMHVLRDSIVIQHLVKVRTIIADFRKATENSFYFDIMRQVEDLDVSILVNAVGCAGLAEKYHMMTPEKNKECMVVNTFGTVLLSQQFIKRFLHRYHRSAIINVSSENASHPIPGMAVSSGAKAFVKQFTMAAAYEYREKIDIIAVHPVALKKPRLDGEREHSLFIVNSVDFASACLRQLGHTCTTSGHWVHGVQSWVFSLCPVEWRLAVWERFIMPKHFEKIKEPTLVTASSLQ